MRNEARQKLAEMIARHGRIICEDKQRCKSFLLEYCYGYDNEVNLFILLLEEDIPAELLNISSEVSTEWRLNRLAMDARERLSLDQEAARWGIEAWASALDMSVVGSKGNSPLLLPPISQERRRARKALWLFPALLALAILVVISGIAGIYQNHVNQVNATATAKAVIADYSSYLPGNGRLVFEDSLSQAGTWQNSSFTDGGACQFTGGVYHVSQKDNAYYTSCPASGIFDNFVFEVQLTITQGDCGGVTFREGNNNGQLYYFQICQQGTYNIQKYVDPTGADAKMVKEDNSSAINAGLGRQNRIAVVADGSTMTFYVNKQQIYQFQDDSYASGLIELIAYPQYNDATDVAYSNAVLWEL